MGLLGFGRAAASESEVGAPPVAPGDEASTEDTKVAKFRRHLHAWWEGYYLDDPEASAEQTPPPAPPLTEEAKKNDKWSAERIKVAELIWGDGFTFPGGADHVLRMVKPMTLTSAKSMLDIGCGLGGATRAIAKTFGTWVIGMEASPALATAGMQYSEMAGLAKRAPIQHFDPATCELPSKKYDAVCLRNIFSNITDKKRLLTQCERALKPGGSILVSDFALKQHGVKSAALTTWFEAEDHPPQPGVLEEFKKDFEHLKLDTRVAEDMTAEFRGIVVEGWANLATILQGKTVEPGEATALAKEIKLWQLRLAALDSGDLRVVRLFALKRTGALS
jgi:ubiquinone/menaquinone biosynthesis C-methylase UbiE